MDQIEIVVHVTTTAGSLFARRTSLTKEYCPLERNSTLSGWHKQQC